MGKRKRRSFYYESRPKRRRERSPFKFLEYIHNTSNNLPLVHHSSGDNLICFSRSLDIKKKLITFNPSELQKVKNTLQNQNLGNSDIQWIIQSLVSEIDSQLEQVCSIVIKYDFFRRFDVFGYAVESINSDQPDIDGWLKDLVKLVVSVSKHSDIKTEYTKTILGIFSSLLLPTKCGNDPLIKDEVENAFENLKVRERYEDLQDDSPLQIHVSSSPLRKILRSLITWQILPTSEMVEKDEHSPLWPRDLRAPYRGPVHYLIEQFSLFLEDFIAPLRRGIKNYMNYVRVQGIQSRFKDENIRVYKRVRLLGNKCIHGSGVCLEVQFDTNTMKRVRWDSCKFLQYGNVVCLTYDDCPELVYALIANRDVQQLIDGRIFLKVLDENPQSLGRLRWMQESRLVMIESKSFFMVYNRTLESFKNMALQMLENNENIPFAKYLVDLNTDVREPLYTRKKNYKSTRADFNCLVKIQEIASNQYKKIPILDVEKWPTREEMGLNEDQYEALKKCLTKKIGILQGPPGTGKTWMGVRIVEFLLNNSMKLFQRKERRPILLLSYTNHALDQFFEKLLELESIQRMLATDFSHMKPFVRVGGRCENEQVKEYTLNVHRKNIKGWSNKRAEMHNSLKSVKFIDTLLCFLQEGIVSVDFLVSEGIISQDHYSSLVQSVFPSNNANYSLLAWLKVFENGVVCNHTTETPTMYNTEIIIDDLFLEETAKRILDDGDKSKIDEQEISNGISPLFVLSSLHHLPNHLLHDIQSSHEAILDFVRKMLCNPNDYMSVEMAMRVDDVWDLGHEDRWRLYKFWIREISDKFSEHRNSLIKQFDDYFKAVENERFQQDLVILTSCFMVGMTTTGAASNMNLLRKIQPRIVVVEEAAQVHEQHIIGCLTNELQHLILIGDHQQLRPAMNNYDLKRSHKTDVSLMERLVMNKFPFHCLTYQHRMRPEISRMLTPAIYPSLRNDSSVLSYPDIKGVKHNLFFINHQNQENQTEFSTSYTNDFEADMIAQLYKYLILQGYSNTDVTILSAYNDQVRTIRKKVTEISKEIRVSERRLEQRVHITAVDNFQGEENRIILLSLVRSNAECKLGHLGDPLRICVSLSRAKEGLYVIGNFEMIANRKNPLWMEIIKSAREFGVIGDSMPLVCQNHPETVTKVSTPQDFEKVPDGGCTEFCATQLQCGHVCKRQCHGDDSVHNLPCQKPCLKLICERKHPCPKKCHEECGRCVTKVMKKFDSCKHEVEVPCYLDPASTPCPVKCTKTRPCGHPCTLDCGQSCDQVPCTKTCLKKVCDSGHRCRNKCYEKCGECWTMVKKKYSNCEHEKELPCCFDIALFRCPVLYTKQRPCGHTYTSRCGQKVDTDPCKVIINVIHPTCKHQSKIECYKNKDFICKNKCMKLLQCGHRCKGDCSKCSNGRLHIPCKVMCSRKLICGHNCSDLCWNPCPPCTEICKRGCVHKVCYHLCKDMCQPCQENCSWECYDECENGFACSEKCFEDCGRPPCNKRCKRSLKCSPNHRCVGLCGENCPSICKRCDKKKLSKYARSKKIDDSVFVELIECGHIFEVDTMDKYMRLTSKDGSIEFEDEQVALKACPECLMPIRKSMRYKNIIHQTDRDLLEVNRKSGEGIKKLFFDDFAVSQFPSFKNKNTKDRLARCRNRSVCTVYKSVKHKTYPRLKASLSLDEQRIVQEIKNSFKNIISWIFCHSDVVFTQRELNQLNDEVERFSLYVDLILLTKCENTTRIEKDVIESHLSTIRCPDGDIFNRDDIVSAQSVFDEIRKKHGFSCQWMPDEDRRISFKDVVCGKRGSWYKCSKGHIYLSEVGGSVENPMCPDCQSIESDTPSLNEEELEMEIN